MQSKGSCRKVLTVSWEQKWVRWGGAAQQQAFSPPWGFPKTWDFPSILLPEPVQDCNQSNWDTPCIPHLEQALREVKWAQRDQREWQHCFRTYFTSLTPVRGFPGFDLNSSQVRAARSGPYLFHKAKLSAWHGRVPVLWWQSQLRLLCRPPVHLSRLYSLPRLTCAPCNSSSLESSAQALCSLPPLPGALSRLHPVPPVPTQPGSLAAIHHPRQDHPPPSFAALLDRHLTRHPSLCFLVSSSAF